jgi:hypothetical protein
MTEIQKRELILDVSQNKYSEIDQDRVESPETPEPLQTKIF